MKKLKTKIIIALELKMCKMQREREKEKKNISFNKQIFKYYVLNFKFMFFKY